MKKQHLNYKKIVLPVSIGSIIVITVLFFYSSKILNIDYVHSPQSKKMIMTAEQHSFLDVFKKCPKPWPPTYPAVLFILQKLGIPLKIIHLVLFYGVLAWMILFTNKYVNNISWYFPVLFYSIAMFNYFNMRQFTAEHIVIPVSLITFSLMIKYLKTRNITNLVLLSIAVGFLFSSRYFVLIWLFPILSYKILFFPGVKFKERFVHFVVFCFSSLYLISIWISYVYLTTGHITGMNRFVKSKELTSFCSNVFFTLKTMFVDFFSVDKVGGHWIINKPYQISPVEFPVIILIFIVFMASIIFIIQRYRKSDNRLKIKNFVLTPFQSVRFMIFEYFIFYILMTIVLWSIGNNDPIYTRFLYPSYIFLIMSAFIFYDWIIDITKNKKYKLLFIVLYVCVLSINIYKTFQYKYL